MGKSGKGRRTAARQAAPGGGAGGATGRTSGLKSGATRPTEQAPPLRNSWALSSSTPDCHPPAPRSAGPPASRRPVAPLGPEARLGARGDVTPAPAPSVGRRGAEDPRPRGCCRALSERGAHRRVDAEHREGRRDGLHKVRTAGHTRKELLDRRPGLCTARLPCVNQGDTSSRRAARFTAAASLVWGREGVQPRRPCRPCTAQRGWCSRGYRRCCAHGTRSRPAAGWRGAARETRGFL